MLARIRDGLNFLSKLNYRRFQNGIAVLMSYYMARLTKQGRIAGSPVSISIEPTTYCNLRCPQCPSGLRSFSRPTGKIDYALFKKVIDELYPKLMYLILYFQGEPFLHRDILAMIRYANQHKLYTATSTNAHQITSAYAREIVESGLDRLIVSLDGTSQDTYEQYRVGGQLEKVLAGINHLCEWKTKLRSKTPHLIIQFLVFKQNEHQVDQVLKLKKLEGVDEVRLKTAQIYDFAQGSDLLPVQEKYRRYTTESGGKFRIKNKLLNHCWKMWHSCVITWDGGVAPCCFDKDAKYRLGNLNSESFQSIWQGEAYHSFRKRILGGRKQIDICQNCTEGTKIWL